MYNPCSTPVTTLSPRRDFRRRYTYLEIRSYLRTRMAREVAIAPRHGRIPIVQDYAELINTAYADKPEERTANIERRNATIAREFPYVNFG